MKLKRTIRNLFLTTQICCLALAGGWDMAVLCRAENGRVAIEAANGDDCAKSPTCHSEESSHDHTECQISARDDCGDCVDYPLSIGWAIGLKKASQVNITLSQSAATILATDRPANSATHLLPPELVPPPPYFTPLSSIILLI